MANPLLGQTKVDKILTQFSVAYRNNNLIADRIMPILAVKEKSGKYAKYGKDNLRLPDSMERAPGTRAMSFDYTVSQGTYACTEKAIEKEVPIEFQNNQDDPYDAKRDATAFAIDKMWGYQENALATYMASTGNLTSNVTLSGTSQFSDYANSDPLGIVKTGRTTMLGLTGKKPNVLVLGNDVWETLLIHPDLTARIVSVGMTNMEAIKKAMAELFQVEEILIGDAIKLASNEGQTDDLDNIWGKHAWLIHRARPSLMAPTFGITFKDVQRQVDVRYEDAILSDVVRVRDSFDQNVIDVNLAYFIKDAVA